HDPDHTPLSPARRRETYLDRLQRRLPQPVARVVSSLRREEITLPAAGLAFYALVSLVPFVILVLWLTGLVVGTDRVREVGEQMARLAPARLGIDKAFTRAADLGAALGLGAVAGLLWPASSYGAGLVRPCDRLSP